MATDGSLEITERTQLCNLKEMGPGRAREAARRRNLEVKMNTKRRGEPSNHKKTNPPNFGLDLSRSLYSFDSRKKKSPWLVGDDKFVRSFPPLIP